MTSCACWAVTEYKFRHVTEGLYEARIKLTGCTDCPDSFDGCHSQPQATEQVNITTPVMEMGCYNWHPDTFTLRPHNGDVTVTWSPAFRKSGLRVYLYDKNTDEVTDETSFAAYEMLDNPVTEYTFHNVREGLYEARMLDKPVTEYTFRHVTEGLYEARIEPSGCFDCPDKFKGCHPQPQATDPLHIRWPDTDAVDLSDVILPNMTVPPPQLICIRPVYVVVGAIVLVAVVVEVIMIAICVRKYIS